MEQHGISIFDQSLHLTMVHVEKNALKRLFINGEVSEKTYRNIYSKLSLQQEKIEEAQHDKIDPKMYTDRKDIFDRMVNFIQNPFDKNKSMPTLEERLEYYRAQMIMARKAVQTIEIMQVEHGAPVFFEHSYESVKARYQQYRDRSAAKADALLQEHHDSLAPYLKQLAERSLASSGARALAYLRDNGLIDEMMEEDIIHTYAPAK
jgi:CPA1 family monovalent cation:H+ antiporter